VLSITPKQFADLLIAFREQPGNYTNAAKYALCQARTAKRAWEEGWPRRPWGRVPIRKLLEQEAEAARAARIQAEYKHAQEEADQAIMARADAIKARAEEAGMVKTGRKNATNLAIVAAKLVVIVDTMINAIHQQVNTPGFVFKPEEVRRWVATTSVTMLRAESVMRLALELERIVAGEPVAILGLRSADLTPQQMVDAMKGLARTMDRAQGLTDREQLGKARAAGAEQDALKKN
jgi:hypothetical protein